VSAISSAVQLAIRRCVAKHRAIQAAYVFGSVATGRTRPDSDIDVAVLVHERLRPHERLKFRLQLVAGLSSALRRSDVDVVILNESSTLLAHRVLSQGILVYERSATERVRFQVRTASLYLDLVPMLETQLRYLKKHTREGRIIG
jgi:uncharacterized protein